MSLFKRSVVSEILGHGGVVFSTLLVVWLSVLLVRLLGEAANGTIGADVVFGLAAFSSITALPTILSVSLFIAVLTTVTRNFRESEMVVWFASGLSLKDWINPVMRCAVPVAVLIALLTLLASPWAYRQIEEYRQRFEQRSDLSKVTAGQFIETQDGARVFFAEEPTKPGDELGKVIARVLEPDWLSVITADSARVQNEANGDRFLVLSHGRRYDLKPGNNEFRLFDFQRYGFRLESSGTATSPDALRATVERQIKARPTMQLFKDATDTARSQLMWRIALPLAALNLALLALPLGAVNPRLGRSGDILIAGLVGLLYMNLINLSRGWISNGKLDFGIGVWLIHALFLALMAYMMWRKLRVKAPKDSVGVSAA
ncbi:LPS export ABC transporter permease LptF [Eoetvoesiella caeni]|uniref:Lipopolysaccharide export system permease protein LptF n=1 Tax=Eoetvoesiella caeni TaxID=645616 RepID=A0A366HMK6_9BURK|nr:LPS export ABC transporter permease LptF [Eoetvoesiella caeni]MCI2807148.1 LPS export ABC transporter permease LptF [Eoetvoesiella caeni]NYT53455.1 LPS export ABC transporter permease LptF [Eoetvoesiella caeni]RBP43441.1 lipopolysaccharide export system permease protein [Eoetvoesiella caeni]